MIDPSHLGDGMYGRMGSVGWALPLDRQDCEFYPIFSSELKQVMTGSVGEQL